MCCLLMVLRWMLLSSLHASRAACISSSRMSQELLSVHGSSTFPSASLSQASQTGSCQAHTTGRAVHNCLGAPCCCCNICRFQECALLGLCWRGMPAQQYRRYLRHLQGSLYVPFPCKHADRRCCCAGVGVHMPAQAFDLMLNPGGYVSCDPLRQWRRMHTYLAPTVMI